MELFVSLKLAYSKFHGIPWNCFCQRNWRTPSSMEFHGTARVIEIGALEVPWNSMELLVSWNLFLLFNGTIGIINALSVKMVYNSVEFEFQNFDANGFQLCRMN